MKELNENGLVKIALVSNKCNPTAGDVTNTEVYISKKWSRLK